jgi:hypothetical protein
MRLAGRKRERARNGDHPRAGKGQPPVKFGKADVVADGQSDRAERRLRAYDFGAMQLDVGFSDRHAAGQVDVKQVNLAIGGEPRAVRSEQHRGVVIAAVLGRVFGDRSGDEMDLELASERRHPGERLTVERFRRRVFLRTFSAPVEDLLSAIAAICTAAARNVIRASICRLSPILPRASSAAWRGRRPMTRRRFRQSG